MPECRKSTFRAYRPLCKYHYEQRTAAANCNPSMLLTCFWQRALFCTSASWALKYLKKYQQCGCHGIHLNFFVHSFYYIRAIFSSLYCGYRAVLKGMSIQNGYCNSWEIGHQLFSSLGCGDNAWNLSRLAFQFGCKEKFNPYCIIMKIYENSKG